MTRTLTTKPLQTALALALVAGLALTACGKKDADKAPAPATTAPAPSTSAEKPKDRDIQITSLKPEGATFKPGQTVKIAIELAYTLPADGGSVGIVIQDGKNAPISNRLIPATPGSGTLTEEIEFKVPATDRIVVHVPLYVKGETKSSTVATRHFPVKAS